MFHPFRRIYISNPHVAPHSAVFGVGMAGRVVVEGAQTPRGVVIEAYVAASSETYVSKHDLFCVMPSPVA